MTIIFLVAVLFVFDAQDAAGRDSADCPRQEKQINLNIQHKVVDIAELRKDAEVRFGRRGELMQIRAGAGGRARQARVVMTGVRGQVNLKWRSQRCGNVPCAISSVIESARADPTSASTVDRENEITPCPPGS